MMKCFLCILMVVMMLFSTPVVADEADDAALNEIASALIQKGHNGVAYGSTFYAALPKAPDGKRIIRIYPKPYDREMALINKNLWYQLNDPKPLRPQLQEWVLETYTREFPAIYFEITDDPEQASMFMLEAQFVPNATSGKSRPPEAYTMTAANSMNAGIHGHICGLIHFNLGNPWLKQYIENGAGPVVRATILNEFFNAFAVSDFQDLDATKLSPTTQAWLTAHRANIDDYTITRSGGPRDDEHLKALDRIIINRLFQ